jgi:hypothetical protein
MRLVASIVHWPNRPRFGYDVRIIARVTSIVRLGRSIASPKVNGKPRTQIRAKLWSPCSSLAPHRPGYKRTGRLRPLEILYESSQRFE